MSEMHPEILLEAIDLPIIIVSKIGDIININNTFCRHFKLDKKEIIGKGIRDVLSNEKFATQLEKHLSEAMSTMTVRNFIANHTDEKIRINISPLVVSKESTLAVISFTSTTKKPCGLMDDFSSSIISNVNAGMALHKIVTDKNNIPIDFIYIDINPNYEKITHLKREKIIGKRGKEVIPNLEQKWIDIYGDVALTRKSRTITDHSNYLDKYWEVKAFSPEKNYFAVILTDITNKIKSEQELERSKNLFEQLFFQSETSTQLLDAEGWCLRINPKLSELFGVKPEDIEGRKYNILHDGEIIKTGVINKLKSVFEYHKTVNWEVHFDIGNASETTGVNVSSPVKKWFSNKAYPILNDKGKLEYVIVQHEEITKRKIAEKQLHETKERYDLATMVGKVGTWDWDIPTGNLIWNDETYRVLGLEPGSVKPSYELFLDLLHKDDRDFLDNNVQAAWYEKKPYFLDCRVVHKNGDIIFCHVTGKVDYDSIGNPVRMMGTFQDITDRKKTEQELLIAKENAEKNEFFLKKAQEIGKIGHFSLNPKTNIVTGSPELYRIFDIDTSSPTLDEFNNTVHPEDRHLVFPFIERAVKEKIPYDVEHRVCHKDGTILYVRSKGETIILDIGERMVGTVQDITQQKNVEMELIKAKEKSDESDRLKSAFLQNMSHEVRTPMNGIIGFASLLNKPGLPQEKKDFYTSIIQNSGQQLLKIIDDILEISTLETKQVRTINEPININNLLTNLFSIFEFRTKEKGLKLILNKEISDEESTIVTDSTKLHKIISNLIENAIKYTVDGWIEIGCTHTGDKLIIYVKDTGIGIDQEYHKTVFDRFAQEDKNLSDKLGGLGIGLSIAKENTELIGGTIELTSQKGEGSTFLINIPYKPAISVTKGKKITDQGKTISTIKNKISILVSEDEDYNFLYIEEILLNNFDTNCEIIRARTGIEALEICKSNKNINIVLMDIKMPLMDGLIATKEIKKIRPGLPIIAQTAYATHEDKMGSLQAGCDNYISKPIDGKILISIIGNLLAQKQPASTKQ